MGMGQVKDLGRRIELVSMDGRFHDVTIGLYERPGAEGAVEFQVHTYSTISGANERMAFVARAMRSLGGMEAVAGKPHAVRFACGAAHRAACRRLFLECCKLPSDDPLELRPASAFDKKSDSTMTVVSRGDGVFEVTADGAGEDVARRRAAIAQGYIKLAELDPVPGSTTAVRFPCGHDHEPLMTLLLVRALNARAAMREQELMARRGVLVAPSAQGT
jgi:hypothetical protein